MKIFKKTNVYEQPSLKPNDYDNKNHRPSFNDSNHYRSPCNCDFHPITTKLLEENTNSGRITKYETHTS